MAISSRFQPRNLAYRGFNPFFPSGGDYDWGPGVERRVGPLSGGKTEYGSVDQPTESEIQPSGDFVLDTDVVTDVVNDVNNVIPPNTDFTPDPMSDEVQMTVGMKILTLMTGGMIMMMIGMTKISQKVRLFLLEKDFYPRVRPPSIYITLITVMTTKRKGGILEVTDGDYLAGRIIQLLVAVLTRIPLGAVWISSIVSALLGQRMKQLGELILLLIKKDGFLVIP